MKGFFIFLVCMLVENIALADVVYNIDYEPPSYTNGQQIGGGTTRTISDSISGFDSQGLLLNDGGQISYLADTPYESGIHVIVWDFTIPFQQGSSVIIDGLLWTGGGDVLFNTTVAGDGSGMDIEYGSGFPSRPSISMNAGQSYSFEVLMDLDSDYYSFWVDGSILEDTVSIGSDDNLWGVYFGQNQTLGLEAGIDNFRWEIVPEPSTIMLLGIGGLLLAVRRKRQ